MHRVHGYLVDLRTFINPNFALGSLFSFILGMGLYGSSYLVLPFLSRVRGYDSLHRSVSLLLVHDDNATGSAVTPGWLRHPEAIQIRRSRSRVPWRMLVPCLRSRRRASRSTLQVAPAWER